MNRFVRLSRMSDDSRRRDDRGAVAIIMAVVVVVLFAAAAIGVDIASQVASKQRLHDTMDMAAHEASFSLSTSGSAALAAAVATAKAADPDSSPEGKLYCVVASNTKVNPLAPDWTQIPATCKPGAKTPYNTTNYPRKTPTKDGFTCNEAICAIPCDPITGSCNTISVWDSKTVKYGFAPVIGFDEGNTGVVVSTACAGTCGTSTPNPMDVVILADRTGSMGDTDRKAMVTGIEGALKTMNPLMHYVALGALHKSNATNPACMTDPVDYVTPEKQKKGESNKQYSDRVAADLQVQVQKGTWVPVKFSNDYLVTGATTPTLNPGSELVRGLSCIRAEESSGSFKTHLASPLKAAARYLLGWDSNNLGTLPLDRPGTVRKAIIFETDGKPQEVLNKHPDGLGLTVSGDMGVGGETSAQVRKACKNFTDIATATKNEGPIIITVGFGAANTATCGTWKNASSGPRYVRDALAAAASPHPGTGEPSQG